MDYKIVKTYGLEDHLDLEKRVNREIKNGYEPIGGITIIKSLDGSDRYFQAMIKKN